jgi:hypothetical protein
MYDPAQIAAAVASAGPMPQEIPRGPRASPDRVQAAHDRQELNYQRALNEQLMVEMARARAMEIPPLAPPFVPPPPVMESRYVNSHEHLTDEPVFAWEIQSGRVTKGGRRTRYSIALFADGCVSCDCPEWANNLNCKHITSLSDEVSETYAEYLRGKDVKPPAATVADDTPPSRQEDGKPLPTHVYGRVLDI